MTSKRTRTGPQRDLRWPDDPETVTAADIDFEALAHVLANTCRRGGRCRHYHSIAAHAAIVSEEIEALDGLGDEDRRTLALHALLAGTASAWFRGEWAGSARAAEPGSRLGGRDRSRSGPGRTARLAAKIEGAVRQAAGLDAVLDEEHAELLRFVERMTVAAERRDLFDADEPGSRLAGRDRSKSGPGPGPGAAWIGFPPLKRRIRSIAPDRAAEAWLARFRALAGDRAAAGKSDAAANGGPGGGPGGGPEKEPADAPET